MQEYYILTLDVNAKTVLNWVFDNNLKYEAHLNRTRFWVPEGRIMTEFQLRFSDCCPRV
jgi:hypothetical protein